MFSRVANVATRRTATTMMASSGRMVVGVGRRIIHQQPKKYFSSSMEAATTTTPPTPNKIPTMGDIPPSASSSPSGRKLFRGSGGACRHYHHNGTNRPRCVGKAVMLGSVGYGGYYIGSKNNNSSSRVDAVVATAAAPPSVPDENSAK